MIGIFEKFSRLVKPTQRGIFLLQEGYYFKGNRLCMPKCETHECIFREIHIVSLARHSGEDKTYMMAEENYYSPHMPRDI